MFRVFGALSLLWACVPTGQSAASENVLQGVYPFFCASQHENLCGQLGDALQSVNPALILLDPKRARIAQNTESIRYFEEQNMAILRLENTVGSSKELANLAIANKNANEIVKSLINILF